MLIQELLKQINEEGISEQLKKRKIEELQKLIKEQNEMYDDHGPVIMGPRDEDPHFS